MPSASRGSRGLEGISLDALMQAYEAEIAALHAQIPDVRCSHYPCRQPPVAHE